MRPNHVNVLGLQYQVKWTDKDDSGGDKLGWCDFTGLNIYIIEEQPKTALANTFLHELIHAVHYGMGINSTDEENLTNRITNGICAVWADNPDAFKWVALMLTPKKKAKRKSTNGKRKKVTKRSANTGKPRRRR
jgi:hypothetical protein